MNSDIFKGKWLQIKGAVKKQWGQLTDDDLDVIDGDMDRLAGVLQERYGYSRERAHEEVHRFTESQDYNRDSGGSGYNTGY